MTTRSGYSTSFSSNAGSLKSCGSTLRKSSSFACSRVFDALDARGARHRRLSSHTRSASAATSNITSGLRRLRITPRASAS